MPVFQRPGSHDRRNRTSKSKDHRNKCPSRKTYFSHQTVHHIGDARHISAVLQERKRQEQNENVGQEGQDSSDSGDNTVHDQRGQRLIDLQRFQRTHRSLRNHFDKQRHIFFQPVADGERQEKYPCHDHQKDRKPKPLVR